MRSTHFLSVIGVIVLFCSIPSSSFKTYSRNCILQDSTQANDTISLSSKKVSLDTTVKVGQSVSFGFSSSKSLNISPEAKAYYDTVVEFLKNNPKVTLRIIGYTDNHGSPDELQRSSDDRANQVQNYFMRKGISKFRLLAFGDADRLPIGDNRTVEGRARNNRVEITIINTK